MVVSKEYEKFLTETLGEQGKFGFRRMFGGIGIYSGEVIFAVVDNDTLFFRVTEGDIPRFESHGMGPFAPIPGRPPMRSYFQVPEEILNDRSELPLWIRRAIQAALDAKKVKGANKGSVSKKTALKKTVMNKSTVTKKTAKKSITTKSSKKSLTPKRTTKK
jgi:DNA transformation protein